MTNVEFPQQLSQDSGKSVASHDLVSEQAIEYKVLTHDKSVELGQLLTERLKGIDVMHASISDSLAAMRAASLTTSLLKEALVADPEGLSAIGGYRGPIDKMSYSAALMHSSQTGHNLPGTFYNTRDQDYDQALSVLDAVKQKVNDRRWDGSYSRYDQADAMTASLRKQTMQLAVLGLGLIAEERGEALVSPDTARQVIEFLESR